jgi:GGDEF domain-containing protein
VGASVGVAVGTGDAVARPPSAALSAADAAMYRAKSLGRGRWVMAP